MSKLTCPECSTPVKTGWRFCPKCKVKLIEGEPTITDAGGWTRSAEDLAYRVELTRNMKTSREITIEEGTRGLMFLDGRLGETLPPGRHQIGGLWKRLSGREVRTLVVVLVRTADLELQFFLDRVRSAERIPFDVTANLVLRIGDPDRFFVTLLQGRERLKAIDLRGHLFEEIRNALDQSIHAFPADSLRSDLEVKRKLELDVEEHLKRTLGLSGLELIQFRTVKFEQGELEEIKDAEAAGEIGARKLDAARKQLEVENKEIDVALERNQVRERMRQAINSERMAEIRSGDQLKDFLQEVDKANMIREQELEEFKRAFDEKKEDHETKRKHLLQILDLQRDQELSRMKQEAGREDAMAGLQHDITMDEVGREALRKARLEDASTSARVGDIGHESEIERRAREHAQSVKELEDLNRLRASKKREDLDLQGVADEQEIRKRSSEQELAERMARAESELEIQEIRAAAEAEKVRLEAYHGLNEEQILAINSAKSPQVAEALKAKFQAQAAADTKRGEEIEGLYKQWIAGMEKDKQAFADFAKEALHTQKDTAGAVAKPAGSAGGGLDASAAETGSAAIIVCPHCRFRIEAAANARHCPNCGKDL